MSKSLQIFAHGANHLEDVEHFGKNDPYAQFTFDLSDKKSFHKTAVKKNAGKNVEWNQEIIIEYDPNRNHTLYVEVLDDETTADKPIGFADIPLRQVIDAPGQSFKGRFDLYTGDAKAKGTISLTLSILNPGQAAHVATSGPELKGFSQLDGEHQSRFKSLKNKEKASDLAVAAGIGAAILGAKKLHDEHKKDKGAHEQ
ncbi:hypothetical protein BGX21_009004 [Mortierella sp. AD011]|nr:hypothetical protein BGX20_008957 [Mortierella sp. AD010]KAF9397318.1 hypothetical protein BGX21_009004 [Mortierella sp. AD011]